MKVMKILFVVLSISLLCTACGGQEMPKQQEMREMEMQEIGMASVMELIRTEGSVGITDGEGENVALVENMQLYSGYDMKTDKESFAWINLDSAKLVKMDAVSEAQIQKSGRKLEILVNSGNVFFRVTRPLENDETMEIHTSTMTVGIRGTCGWVEVVDENHMKVYILEGKVECSIMGESQEVAAAYVSAREMAEMVYTGDGKGEIKTGIFDETQIPDFVSVEMDEIGLADAFAGQEEPGEGNTDEKARDDYEGYLGWYECDENGGLLMLFRTEEGGYKLHGERPLTEEEKEESPGSVTTGILEQELELRDGVFYGAGEGQITVIPDNGRLILEGTEIDGVYHRSI
ncbi:MAG: FecR domain-containing protein [Coprococcus sp.]|nr:FecR domain-containing protein [Coprococcus sp.]